MTASTKAPDAGWARLSAGIIHDPDWLDLDAAGRLVFVAGIALAKAANRDGELSLRAMTGIMVGALTQRQVAQAASDLVGAGLWEATSHPDRYMVTGFLRWNESTADQEGRRARKVIGAHRTNHQLGRHLDPEPDCPECQRVATANAIATAPPIGTAVAIDRSDADETRRDETKSAPPPAVTPRAEPDELRSVHVADALMVQLGYADPPPAGADVRAYVARALERGWTADQLAGLAAEACARDTVANPLGWLRGALKRCANEDPPTDLAAPAPIDTSDRGKAWVQVALIARRGPTDWRERTELDARTRAAAHEARVAIRTLPTDEARRQFLTAWDTWAPTPAPA